MAKIPGKVSEWDLGINYWEENYKHPEEMDCIGNSKDHVDYLRAILGMEEVEVKSLVDFGFGLGHLSKAMIEAFDPYRFSLCEPSEYAFLKAKDHTLNFFKPSKKREIIQTDCHSWLKSWQKSKRLPYDLGICTSVFQYIDNKTLEEIIPLMAKSVRYLYLTLPTDKELKRQVSEMEFFDRYAIRRGKSYYRKILGPHFTIVSSRLLESKVHFDESNTLFSDLLFRT
jgi:hypothetical protein